MNGKELKAARARRGIKGAEAGAIIGIGRDGFYRKENGYSRFTLDEALILAVYLGLTLAEFIQIFFDGAAPFTLEDGEDYSFKDVKNPLKAARLHAKVKVKDAAAAIGLEPACYRMKEQGRGKCSLEQCRTLTQLFKLTFQEFNDVFFHSSLPYQKQDVVSYGLIIKQTGDEINAQNSNQSGQ